MEEDTFREIAVEVLVNNVPQSQKLFLSLVSLLDSPEPNSTRKKDAAARIIAKAFDASVLKMRLAPLLKYEELIRRLNPRRIQELPLDEVRTLTSTQIQTIFGAHVSVFGNNELFRERKLIDIRKDAKKVFTLEQIQVFPPEVIELYISRLPLSWFRRLTSDQKQMIVQNGRIDRLSTSEVRVLGGLGLFQEKNEAIRNGIQNLRPKLSERELFILDQLMLSDHPVTITKIAQRFSVSLKRVSEIESNVMRKLRQAVHRQGLY